jgi:hypothetical protein
MKTDQQSTLSGHPLYSLSGDVSIGSAMFLVMNGSSLVSCRSRLLTSPVHVNNQANLPTLFCKLIPVKLHRGSMSQKQVVSNDEGLGIGISFGGDFPIRRSTWRMLAETVTEERVYVGLCPCHTLSKLSSCFAGLYLPFIVNQCFTRSPKDSKHILA